VTAEMAVKNATSRGVNTPAVLEMGRASSSTPMVMRSEKPKNSMEGAVNRRRGRRIGPSSATMGLNWSNLG
jgi:hypothetical protein